MESYFIPMLVEEFNNLSRLGSTRIYGNRWIYTSFLGKPFDEKSDFFQHLVEITPTFEDSISIVIVQFENCVSSVSKRCNVTEFLFVDVVATYALSQQDRSILNGRLSKTAKLTETLLIDELAVRSWMKELHETQSSKGAESLLTIYLGDQKCREDLSIYKEDLLQALACRVENVKPAEGSSYLENLVFYSRSGSIPNTDVGFLSDCGFILKCFLSPNNPENFGFGKFITNITKHSKNAEIAEIIGDVDFNDIANQFDGHVQMPGALVSSLVFLKLNYLIRESKRVLNHAAVKGLFEVIPSQTDVERGIWWCGYFWGFTCFAEEYYSMQQKPPDSLLDDREHVSPIQETTSADVSPISLEKNPISPEIKLPEVEEKVPSVVADKDNYAGAEQVNDLFSNINEQETPLVKKTSPPRQRKKTSESKKPPRKPK